MLTNIRAFIDPLPQKGKPDKIPIAYWPARKLAGLPPAARREHIPLLIDISPDLKTIKYFKVDNDEHVFGHEQVHYQQLRTSAFCTIPSNNLITPERYIRNTTDITPKLSYELLTLLASNKRYTRFGDIITSWDITVDKDVWTTNIDTLFFDVILEKLGVFDDARICTATEIGSGGGHLTAKLIARLPKLKKMNFTDISFYALQTTLRNTLAYSHKGLEIIPYWGKGLTSLEDRSDLIIIDPPYIPVPPFIVDQYGDPYRGTGLIHEAVATGVDRLKLRSKNPHACILINVSSLAKKDLFRYFDEFKDRIQYEPVGDPLTVPLKIRAVNEEWMQWLVDEGGLIYNPTAAPWEEPYQHTLQVYRISRR